MTLKIAILQKRSKSREFEKNTADVEALMREAKSNGADILLLPECYLTGYDLTITNDEAITESDLNEIRNAAGKIGIGVVATSLTKGENAPQNTAFVIDKSGEIILKYNKVHTCDFADERVLESGDDFYVCGFHGVKLGVMICYDREYPESARILMLKGAEIILVPNDCGSMRPRVQALSVRAYENMCGLAMANPNGDNAGNSCAFSPVCWDKNGKCVDNTLLLADDKTEGLFYAEFDMDEIRAYREREMIGNTFRKAKAYTKLLDDSVEYPFIREGQ